MQTEIIIGGAIIISVIAWLVMRNTQNKPNENKELIDNLEQQIASLKHEVSEKGKKITQLEVDLKEAETTTIFANEKVSEMQKTMDTWEEKFTKQAQNALNESALKQSKQLLKDYHEASQKTTEDNKKQFSETNQKLIEDFKAVSEKIKSLNDNVHDTSTTVNTIKNALSNPHSMGQASETILNGYLKSFGLEPNIHYIMQSSVQGDSGNTRRPDAMVFLPNNTVMVIDSKASKFMMDMASSESEAEQTQAEKGFAQAMQDHLKQLNRKDYRTAVDRDYKVHKKDPVDHVIMVMWLASDGLLEILRNHAPDIFQQASQNQIFITGPSGLWSAIGVASQKISLQKQNENQGQIVESVKDLLDSVGTVVGYADKIGKGLNSANIAFEKLQKSVNSRLLPRSHKIIAMGATAPSKALPKRIQGTHKTDEIIENEAPTPQLESP